jgi:Skp family chaperone for outer membrane proteins
VQDDFAGYGIVAIVSALVSAVITGLFSWLAMRTKGETDHSVAVLAEWSKLNEALADRLAAVEKECAQMRKDHAEEIENIRRDHSAEMDDMRRKHRAEMGEMRKLNEGLQRMIAQNSQSTAYLVSETPVTQPRDAGDAD